jgi:hypothetical protein
VAAPAQVEPDRYEAVVRLLDLGPDTEEELVRRVYDSYGGRVGYRNYRGDAMPSFDDLGTPIQDAWRTAARVAWLKGFQAGREHAEWERAQDAERAAQS